MSKLCWTCIVVFLLPNIALAIPPNIACSPERPIVWSGDDVKVNAWVSVAADQRSTYTWNVSGGSFRQENDAIIWNFANVVAGSYIATVKLTTAEGLVECSVNVVVKEDIRGDIKKRMTRETAWSVLVNNEHEARGYGLYSYLLLAEKPNPNNIDRYKKVIESYLLSVPALQELETELEKYGFTPLDLNVTYLLLKQAPPAGEVLSVDWVLNNYDYARARVLLKILPGTNQEGPYIISSMTPFFSDSRLSENYLFQNLSLVPSHIVYLWAREYFNQAAQERYWESGGIKRIALRLRQSVAVMAVAIPAIRTAVDDWITFIK